MSKSDKNNKSPVLAEDDPYAQVISESKENTLEGPKKETAREKKWRQLTQKFETAKVHMKTSFMMGAMVGGGFGLVFGLYSAVANRSLLIIPLATISSAVSFGFFLACGSLIRMDDNINFKQYNLHSKTVKYDAITNQYIITDDAFWKMKYMGLNANKN